MMVRANGDVRQFAKDHDVFLWELADAMEINDGNLSRRLRRELPASEKRRVYSLIEKIAAQKEVVNDEK